MRIVLDTNVLASGVFWAGYPFRVLELWANDAVQVLASQAILLEYSRTLQELGRHEAKSPLADDWISFVFNHATLIDVQSSVQTCRDPDDDKYLKRGSGSVPTGIAHWETDGTEAVPPGGWVFEETGGFASVRTIISIVTARAGKPAFAGLHIGSRTGKTNISGHNQEKWEYVRLNPVREGLVNTPDEWPHQGELNVLRL